MKDEILKLPKAEQHVHIEAAITNDMARHFAKVNKLTVPEELLYEGGFVCHSYDDLQKVYDVIANLVKTKQDYFDLTYDYLKRAAADGVIYNEIFLSPEHAENNNTSYDDMLSGTIEGMEQAKKDFGIESRILMVFVRHYGLQNAERVARIVVDNLHPWVTGATIAGDEKAHKLPEFAKCFELIHGAGLSCTAHVGEIGTAADIREALNALPLVRIGHGIRCIDDPSLVAELIRRNITLEICPTSNVLLGACDSYENHPMPELYRAGVAMSLNSDDPSFLNTSTAQEYQLAHDLFGFTPEQLLEITHHAINSAFCDEQTKHQLLAKL